MSSPIINIKQLFKNSFERFLSKRIPAKKQHQLNNKNIMIYPTRFGLGYLAIVVLIFLLGTNYQNNIILLLSYLLASLFITVMFHSFYNFNGLQISSDSKQQGYAASTISYPIHIKTNKQHFDIHLHFSSQSEQAKPVYLAEVPIGVSTIQLPIKFKQRGLVNLGRVTVYSEYSLGIFKSKTVLDFAHQAIVYPAPKPLTTGKLLLGSLATDKDDFEAQAQTVVGQDDFSELKTFVVGESQARTAWKQLAKGQGHFSKHYQSTQSSLQWLKLSDMPGYDLELKLSYLSYLINELSMSQQTFGLALSEDITSALNIEPSSGIAHQKACLTALAVY